VCVVTHDTVDEDITLEVGEGTLDSVKDEKALGDTVVMLLNVVEWKALGDTEVKLVNVVDEKALGDTEVKVVNVIDEKALGDTEFTLVCVADKLALGVRAANAVCVPEKSGVKVIVGKGDKVFENSAVTVFVGKGEDEEVDEPLEQEVTKEVDDGVANDEAEALVLRSEDVVDDGFPDCVLSGAVSVAEALTDAQTLGVFTADDESPTKLDVTRADEEKKTDSETLLEGDGSGL
jgi:hypothetical protein